MTHHPSHQEPALYVSTTLDAWLTHAPHCYEPDLTDNGTAYRRLDPGYYAWLRERMDAAREKAERGLLPSEAFHHLSHQFNRIHDWAMTHLGKPALTKAVKEFVPALYRIPQPHADQLFTGIRQLPPDQSDWPPVLRDIWNEIVRDLTGWGIDQGEAASVAQGIVEVLVDHQPVAKPVEPAKVALPF